jgi:guanylate kinase
MDAAELLRVKSDTTRQPRHNDGILETDGNEYYFRDLEAFAKDVANGSLVQFEWGGRPGIFYGSRPESYGLEGGARAFAMDVRTSTVPDMVDVFPAGRAVPIQLVAPSASEWINRLDSRGTLAPDDRAMRLKEASESITDALEGNKEGIDYMFLVSADLGVAADALRRLATDGEISWADHVRAKNTARRNLLAMQDLIVR